MTTQQPEALRLADSYEATYLPGHLEVATELRRQHARIVELEGQLAAAQQAVQMNRWIERWHGSGGKEFHEGWSILDEGSRELVAYLGRYVDSQAVSEIVMAHNATHPTRQGMDAIAALQKVRDIAVSALLTGSLDRQDWIDDMDRIAAQAKQGELQ